MNGDKQVDELTLDELLARARAFAKAPFVGNAAPILARLADEVERLLAENDELKSEGGGYLDQTNEDMG